MICKCDDGGGDRGGILVIFMFVSISFSSCSFCPLFYTDITLTRGEINLDAEEIKETKLIQEETEMIEVCLLC